VWDNAFGNSIGNDEPGYLRIASVRDIIIGFRPLPMQVKLLLDIVAFQQYGLMARVSTAPSKSGFAGWLG